MTRTFLACVAMAVALASCTKSEPTPPAPAAAVAVPAPAPAPPPAPPTQAELVSGPLPAGPKGELVRGRCTMCHSEDYLVQQRLSPAAWKKALAKMQKFGAPVTDDEVTALSTWLAGFYTPELPIRQAALVELPASGK